MRPPSLITLVRVPPIRGQGRGSHWAGHRHVPLASTLVQPSYPPVTFTFSLFQPSASLELPLSSPDVSILAHSSRLETTIPSTLTFLPSCYIYTDFFTSIPAIYIIGCTPTYYRVYCTPTCYRVHCTFNLSSGDNLCRTITCTGT